MILHRGNRALLGSRNRSPHHVGKADQSKARIVAEVAEFDNVPSFTVSGSILILFNLIFDQAESPGPGQGTTFTVLLPLVSEGKSPDIASLKGEVERLINAPHFGGIMKSQLVSLVMLVSAVMSPAWAQAGTLIQCKFKNSPLFGVMIQTAENVPVQGYFDQKYPAEVPC